MNIVKVGDYEVGQGHPLLLMAGPCVLEGYEHSLMIGKEVKKIADKLGVPYVFKASYDKANRSSYSSFRGPGLEEGLKILAQIKKDLGVPVLANVAAIFRPMIPDLPIPVMTTRPGQSKIIATAAEKCSSTRGTSSKIASASICKVLRACSNICSMLQLPLTYQI